MRFVTGNITKIRKIFIFGRLHKISSRNLYRITMKFPAPKLSDRIPSAVSSAAVFLFFSINIVHFRFTKTFFRDIIIPTKNL